MVEGLGLSDEEGWIAGNSNAGATCPAERLEGLVGGRDISAPRMECELGSLMVLFGGAVGSVSVGGSENSACVWYFAVGIWVFEAT